MTSVHIVEERTAEGWEPVVAFTERSARVAGYLSATDAANGIAESLLIQGSEEVRQVEIVRGYTDFEREVGRWSQKELGLLEYVLALVLFYQDYLTGEAEAA